MFSKLRFLFLFAFVVHWSTGHGFFLKRWESTPTTLDEKATAHSYSDVRSWPRPQTQVLPFQAEAILAVNEFIPPSSATIPLPIAIQVPQQILPLAMFPAIQAPLQTYKSGHHPPTTHHNSGIPFVKITQPEPSVPIPIPPTTIATVRFVPCLCGNNEERRWPKSGYGAPAPSYQPIHLLPCYCPLVREVEPQYTQPSPDLRIGGYSNNPSFTSNPGFSSSPTFSSNPIISSISNTAEPLINNYPSSTALPKS